MEGGLIMDGCLGVVCFGDWGLGNGKEGRGWEVGMLGGWERRGEESEGGLCCTAMDMMQGAKGLAIDRG